MDTQGTGRSTAARGTTPPQRLRHRGSSSLTSAQVERRQKVLDRIEATGDGRWLWTGQAKTARGRRYPQIMLFLDGGGMQLMNARHVVFYLATGWVPEDVQQYRSVDGDPSNVHPDNLTPLLPLATARARNNLWSTEQLRDYYG